MEGYVVKILSVTPVTHDVRRFRLEKPPDYTFVPGQATEISINRDGFHQKRNPFTFTCLAEDPYLEFTIKIYESHNGVTKELGKLKAGDELIVHDVWGAIEYKGPGVFLAGGAGITPFIAILRRLYKDGKIEGNTLIFSNKTEKDIILREEFEKMLGKNFINTITDEKVEGFDNEFVTKDYIKRKITDFSQHFYVCGPPAFIENVNKALTELGANPEALVFEK